MRHFSPSPIPKDIDKWLYDALTRLQANSQQSSAGLSAIVRGEVPDGSGNPLTPDLSQYFYLPGRNGGQTAFFDTAASGIGVLSSTKNDTKGKIYLGYARGSAFDELNNRLGLKTASPSATLHVVGEPVTSTSYRFQHNGSVTGSGFVVSGASLGPDCLNELTLDSDTTFIASNAVNPSFECNLVANPLSTPTGGVPSVAIANVTGMVLRIAARKTVVGAITFTYTLKNQAGTTVKTGVLTMNSSYVHASTPLGYWEISLNSSECAALSNSGIYTTAGLRFDTVTGLTLFVSDELRISWAELSVPSGTGVGVGGKVAIFQADSTQVVNNTEWQNSSGTALVDVTAAGRLTVESGGSFRHVPGASASTLFKGDANGDATWGTITLLSAYVSDTVAGTVVLGDLIVGNATPKWDKLAGNTTTTRKFLRQVGNGTISALPAWDTLVAGDLPSAVLGWTDDGTVVRLTTSTDQVGIGTTSPGANLGVTNANAASAINVLLKGAASQTGDMLRITDSGNVTRFAFQTPTTSSDLRITMPSGGKSRIFMTPGAAAEQAYIDFGYTTDFGPPLGTNTGVPCPGTRFNTFWDTVTFNPQFCDAYGQDAATCWVLVDIASDYGIFTADTTSASRTRALWTPNGDLTNFGKIRSRKFTVGTTGLSAGVPGIELEETAAGTGVIAIRAPAVVTGTTQIQLLQDLVGTFVMVGDDPPAVATRALGKVDLTGQTAAIASTGLSTSIPAGMYAIEVYAVCTTASGSGAPTLDVTLGWTDVLGATTANAAGLNGTTFPLSLAATGRAQAKFILQVASGNITYSTTINAASGSPQYALYIRVIALG